MPPHLAGGRCLQSFVPHDLHAQPPLFADQGLDHGIAPVAVTDLVRIRLLLDEQPLRLQVRDHPPARFQRGQPVVGRARHIHAAVGIHPADHLQ
jgi:hypothetical protein